MVVKKDILDTLKLLDVKYRKSNSNKDILLFSKLAILELCGWIEESMDDIVRRCAKRYLRNSASLNNIVEKQIIKQTSGFGYEEHFRSMLMRVIGLINFERIEKKVDSIKRTKLKSTLDSLKKIRNSEAHTHIKGIARQINAPSVTKNQFNDVYSGLIEFDRVIKATRI